MRSDATRVLVHDVDFSAVASVALYWLWTLECNLMESIDCSGKFFLIPNSVVSS